MEEKMTNTKLLEEKIKKSGLKLGFIAKKLDISYHWLKKKIAGIVAFKAYEIQILCDLLQITDLHEKDAIFFAAFVEENSTID
jgi:hypothetical protein